MFKKFTEQEIRRSIIPFNHLFQTQEEFEQFKLKSIEHKSSDDYTITATPLEDIDAVKTASQHRWGDDISTNEDLKPKSI